MYRQILIASFMTILAFPALALNRGDQVYGVFGKDDSHLRVEEGIFVQSAASESLIHWKSCDCDRWTPNNSLYFSYDQAKSEVSRRDKNHTTVGEFIGGAAALGALCLLTDCLKDPSKTPAPAK